MSYSLRIFNPATPANCKQRLTREVMNTLKQDL